MEGVQVANEYKKTMNLPKTGFPMRASLAQNEPKRLAQWDEDKLYEQLLKKNEGHEKFVLHDGPPYANGPIHLGHAQNKISKDIVNRYWAMRGYQTPYVPGWDCHGQPIEHKVEETLGHREVQPAPHGQDSRALPQDGRRAGGHPAPGLQAPGRAGRVGQPLPHLRPRLRRHRR